MLPPPPDSPLPDPLALLHEALAVQRRLIIEMEATISTLRQQRGEKQRHLLKVWLLFQRELANIQRLPPSARQGRVDATLLRRVQDTLEHLLANGQTPAEALGAKRRQGWRADPEMASATHEMQAAMSAETPVEMNSLTEDAAQTPHGWARVLDRPLPCEACDD